MYFKFESERCHLSGFLSGLAATKVKAPLKTFSPNKCDTPLSR